MAVACGVSDIAADNRNTRDEEKDPLELELETNINTPVIPKKLRATVLENIRSNVSHLRKQNLAVHTTRSQEVIVVTIPCDELFAANSTTLLPTAAQKLKPLLPYLKQPQLYKMLVAVYSDNTGSEEYADALTYARVAQIDEFFTSSAGENIMLVPYNMGMEDPVTDNNTRANRNKNRRVEFYLVPDRALFQKIK